VVALATVNPVEDHLPIPLPCELPSPLESHDLPEFQGAVTPARRWAFTDEKQALNEVGESNPHGNTQNMRNSLI